MATQICFHEIPSFSEKNSVVVSTVRQVLKNLRENYQKFGKVTDQDLLALSSVFNETLEKALEFVEGNKVVYFHIKPDSVGIFQDLEMNQRNEWENRSPYLGHQFVPTNPLPEIPMAFHSPPGMPLNFGLTPNDWVHVPPQTMPWGTPPEAQPAVIRFTAGDFNPHLVPVKRKCETAMDTLPSKVLVTEEKMAAHMRDLHISDIDPEPEVSNVTCKEEPMEAERLPRLVLSDEVKNFKTEPIIPESILKKLEKPEMALVLWQPPSTDLESKLRELKKLSVKKSKKKENEEKEEGEMDVAIETETVNSSNDNTFRPIDPVPMPPTQNHFFQPVPQFHGYSPFSQKFETNFQTKFA